MRWDSVNAKTQGREGARDADGLASLRPGDLALSEGFRDTPLGPLPETWEVVRLGDVAEFSHRPRDLPSPDAVPFLPMTLIPDQDLYATRWELRSPSEVRSGVFCQEGDLLLAKITPCLENGKQGIVKGIPGGWGIATTEVFPIHSLIVFNEFLALYLKLPEVRRSLAGKMEGTTGRQRLPKAVVESLSVPLPPLPEQRAIAHALRTVQQAREATERVIAAARELKRSLMRHLFTYGPVPVSQADQVELRETEIGPIPAHWKITRLAEVTDKPQYGYTASATEEPVGPRFLRITDIQDGRVTWGTVPYCEVGKKDLGKYLLSPGDILIARIGATTGKTYLVTQCPESVFASYLIRVRVRPGLIASEYLHHFTGTHGYWTQINASKGGRLKQGVNIPVLQSLLLPLPPLLEQNAIARILASVDAKIAAEEARREALDALFHTLLHHLMTGKIRTPGRQGKNKRPLRPCVFAPLR
jgi:type I restriction enzyme S subunit